MLKLRIKLVIYDFEVNLVILIFEGNFIISRIMSILVIYDLNWDYLRLSMECNYIKEFENIGVYDYGLILFLWEYFYLFLGRYRCAFVTRGYQKVSKLDFQTNHDKQYICLTCLKSLFLYMSGYWFICFAHVFIRCVDMMYCYVCLWTWAYVCVNISLAWTRKCIMFSIKWESWY